MKTRIITAIVALLIFLPVLIFGDFQLVGFLNLRVTLLSLAISVLSLVGGAEALKCANEKGEKALYFALIPPLLLPLFTTSSLSFYTPVFLVLIFALLFLGVIKNKELTADKALLSFALIFYTTVSFGTVVILYNTSPLLFPLIFVGAWVTDTFAYFSGYFFGKRKLIPEVSPKKTVEGAIGGTLATTLVFFFYGLVRVDLKVALILLPVGLVASVVSQLGDLAASLIKRRFGIKDYGRLFPGHGGVLDRFDSILAVSAFLYIISLAVKL